MLRPTPPARARLPEEKKEVAQLNSLRRRLRLGAIKGCRRSSRYASFIAASVDSAPPLADINTFRRLHELRTSLQTTGGRSGRTWFGPSALGRQADLVMKRKVAHLAPKSLTPAQGELILQKYGYTKSGDCLLEFCMVIG